MATNFVRKLDRPVKVYKVVRQDEKGNFFTVAHAKNVSTNYRMKQEVVSSVENTPIFAFKSLKAAFAFKHISHFILECVTRELYGNPLRKVLPSVAIANISPERLYDFWCLPIEKEKFITYKTVYKSEHTVMVASFIPLRVITNAMLLEETYVQN